MGASNLTIENIVKVDLHSKVSKKKDSMAHEKSQDNEGWLEELAHCRFAGDGNPNYP